MGAKKVSIIIPVWNACEMTGFCLSRMFHTIKEQRDECEIIIVDNGSTDFTPMLLEAWADKKLVDKVIVNKENLGFPKAVNQGFEASAGEYICVMNNDVYVGDNWLNGMLKQLEKDNCDLISPCFNHPTSGYIPAAYQNAEQFDQEVSRIAEKYKNQLRPMPFLIFACVLIKRSVIDSLGYFLDEQFTPGNFEDNDFCTRAVRRGYLPVVARDVFMHHFMHHSHKLNNVNLRGLLERNLVSFQTKWGMKIDQIESINFNLVMKTATRRFADREVTIKGGV